MARATTDLIDLDVLGPGGDYRTRNRDEITDTAGNPVAALSIAPRLFIARAIAAQRRATPLPAVEREVALTAAAEAFVSTTISGLDLDAYVELTCRVSGLPTTVARAGALTVAESLSTAMDSIAAARPAGAVRDWRDSPPGIGGAVWARRGEVFGVHAPGNAPGVHGLWPQALALGYRVAVRPSRREPFTAHRVIKALRHCGFRPEDALCLPTDYAGADELVQTADLAMVYGGQDVVDRYADDPTVFANGPGRSKILVTADQDWRRHLDVIVDSVAALGGMACVNTTAVLVEGDPEPLARAIADRLASIAPYPNTDARAVLPTMPIESAQRLARHLEATARRTTPVLGAGQVVADLGDGFAALRPAVHLLTAPDADTLNVEFAFPCVWVSGWSRNDGLEPLRRSLVLTAITDDESLVDELLAEPTITNVYRGDHPTHLAAPHIPHDRFLADFLMRNKGFIG